ncbi:hypothetical protein BN59_02073 [Legionella massiliensis]|uniref:SnoaL-like domain-containing protein n=1 Tax=Legionella massiliensis TaxID=1034943 RepID=A0A078L137_9GAMM|nr:hypothetical protein [Legionella massiliensis]CDZ77783.1 hypothetical protein BN59_02073 [Legionella massiliensis]CEE13521.1 hypothetical protein BN1094_02073 [Legionella massiliensis]
MKINLKIPAFLLAIAIGHNTIAAESSYSDSVNLDSQRRHVITEYILDLGKADPEGITALFSDGGTVISTSKGEVGAYDFFHSFLPNIESADTEVHQTFLSKGDENHYAARFRFNFKLKDGEMGDGEYIDEFIFENNSAKLISVYMFENLKFKPSK